MRAVYDRWHLGQPDALDRFSGEQAFTVPAPELERDFLHMINDGFVSGSSSRNAEDAIAKYGCSAAPSKHGVAVRLHRLPRASPPATAAAADTELHKAASRVAAHGELLLVIAEAAQQQPLQLLLKSARRASVNNILLVVTDASLADALRSSGVTVVLRDVLPEAPTRPLALQVLMCTQPQV